MNRIRRLLSPQAPSTNAWAPSLAVAILVAIVAISAAAWQSQIRPQAASKDEIVAHLNPVAGRIDSIVRSASPSRAASPQHSQAPALAQSSELEAVPAQQAQEKAQNQDPSEAKKKEQDAKDAERLTRQKQESLEGQAKAAKREAAEAAKAAEDMGRRAKDEAQSQDQQVRSQADQDAKKAATLKLAAADKIKEAREDAEKAEAFALRENQEAQNKDQLQSEKAEEDSKRAAILEKLAHENAQYNELQAKEQAERDSRESEGRRILSDQYGKWLDEDVVYIIDDAERSAFLALKTNEEREKFIEDFWQRRDSADGSAGNGFKQEHYRRIAYANQHFGSKPGDGVPGWKTDRGHMYIVYGPADEIDSHPTPADGAVAKESWLYHRIEGLGDNLTFTFADRTGHGDYRLAPSPASGTN